MTRETFAFLAGAAACLAAAGTAVRAQAPSGAASPRPAVRPGSSHRCGHSLSLLRTCERL